MKNLHSTLSILKKTTFTQTKHFWLIVFCLGFFGTLSFAQNESDPGLIPIEPSANVPAAAAATTSLSSIFSVVGKYQLSVDGIGSTSASMDIQVDKPNASATVHKAFLLSTTVFGASVIADGCITLNGSAVNWDDVISSSIFNTHWADVTTLVAATIDGFPAGISTLPITECSSGSIDGNALLVVFNDATTNEKTINILAGIQNPSGDDFSISLIDPIDPVDPDAFFDMGLGVGYSFQGTSQVSTIDINGQRLTSSAGGQDDGETANGSLITVGGIGDSNANPPNPNAPPSGNPPTEYDDELYNILPFITNTTNSVLVNTANPSNDDNIFLAYFVISGEAVVSTVCPTQIVVGNSAGQCGANVSYLVTAGSTQTAGLPSGSLFPVGTTTNTFINPACSFDVIVNDTEDPSLSCPSNVSVNTTQSSCTAVVNGIDANASDNCSVTYTYTLSGATTGSGSGDASGTTFNQGTTTVTYTATDGSSFTNSVTCSFDVVVTCNPTSSGQEYVLVGKEELSMEENVVHSGGVGVTDSDGEAEIEENSLITATGTFLRAAEIDINSGAQVADWQEVPATPNLPTFCYNPNDPDQYNDVEVEEGETVTLTGNNYDDIEAEDGATIIFDGHDVVYLEDFKMEDEVTVIFNQCTKLVCEGKFTLGDENEFNTAGNYKVEVHCEKKATINEASEVYAIVYSQQNFVAKQADDNATTQLHGLFIGEKVYSHEWVEYWTHNFATCSAPPMAAPEVENPVTSAPALQTATPAETETSTASTFSFAGASTSRFGLFPNPARDEINLKLENASAKSTIIRIYNLQGQMMTEKEIDQALTETIRFDVSNYLDGVYNMVIFVKDEAPTTQKFIIRK